MLPKHWVERKFERLQFLPTASIVEFANVSSNKVLTNIIKRNAEKYKFLMDFNLEERRQKLRELLEKDEENLAREHENQIETIDKRRERLKHTAQKIRLDKELQRQEIVKEKYFLRDRLNLDTIRNIQNEKHLLEINKDREKLKYFDKILKRTKECEEHFWAEKMHEQYQNMLDRENKKKEKDSIINTNIIDQMKEREHDRQIKKEEELKQRQYFQEQSQKLLEQMENEKIMDRRNIQMRKEKYRNELDQHLKLKRCMEELWKGRENAFNIKLIDENQIKLKSFQVENAQRKIETRKHLVNYMNYNKCIEEQRKLEDDKLNAHVISEQINLEKKHQKVEKERMKKYNDLIKSIKSDQRNQIEYAAEQKKQLITERLLEKKQMQEKIDKDLEIEKREELYNKKIRKGYNNDLCDQIKFNDYLKQIKQKDRNEEIEDMKRAEEEYHSLIQQVRERESLRNLHPWREQTV